MNLRVFDPKASEPTVCIRLAQDGCDVNIMACRPDGTNGDLIGWFTADGTLALANGVKKDFGFQLNEDGALVIE